MQTNFKLNKAGVSLIAVLLFMLIATIAATATWKWITSEGFSSTSRMLKREAYQSSMAGIENARAWMTYHPNEVGALIRQYLDGGRQPINLNVRLSTLQRDGQNYNVWLTGVNVEGTTYKLKVYSAGKARNDSKHNEVAIFNVDGLYRVQIPQEKVARKVDFDYNYFGGTTSNHGDVFARSMLVNGNLEGGNPASIDSNLVVTGNFTVSGNSIAVHGTACVGGNLDADNGIVGNNFYVGGNLKNLKVRALTANKGSETINLGNKIYGNLYVEGDITAANGHQVIDGNLTLKGKWTTNMTGYNASVGGDLCVEADNGQIYFPSQNREFKASGNVWMETDYPMWTGTDNFDKYQRIVLGTKDKDVYVKTGHSGSDYAALRLSNTFTEIKNRHFGWDDNENSQNQRKWGKGNADEVYRDVFKNRPGVEGSAGPGQKVGIHYLYNWPSTPALVSLEEYDEDTYWKARGLNEKLLVYMLAGERFWDTHNESSYKSINFTGNQITGSPYCRRPGSTNWFGWFTAPAGMKEKARPTCDVTPWFKVDGNFKAFPATRPSNLTCAKSVKDHCDSIWEPTGGCGSATRLVPDALKTGISYFESYANKSTCVTTLLSGKAKENFNFADFNSCYTQAKTADEGKTGSQKILYNDYLVIRITSAKNIFHSSKGTLTGKYLFIIDNDLGEMMKIPATSAGSYVFMYFKDGLSSTILPMDGSDGLEFNYFIYTKNNISNTLFNQTILKGSIYAAVEDEATGEKTCAKVNEMTFNKGLEYNQDLVSDLTNSRIICSNDGGVCGGNDDEPTTPTSSTSTDVDSDNGKDRYFISMASQLGITIESRYEAEERPPELNIEENGVKPSYIVMPRIIYLPSDPYGELTDYYNVLALNGSTLTKDDVKNSVSCSGSIPTTGKLFTGSALAQGTYKCQVSPANNDPLPFWVVVGKTQRGDGEVSFQDPSRKMSATTTSPVPVNVLVSPHSSELTVAVNCPAAPNEAWEYTFNTTFYNNSASSGTTCVFTLPVSSQDEVYQLFSVRTTNATSGTLTFTLMPGEGYTLGSPYNTNLFVASTATITRDEVTSLAEMKTFCANNAGCPCATSNCTDEELQSWPSCSYTGRWVEPQSAGLVVMTNELNESWSVPIGGTGDIVLDSKTDECIVIIPEGTTDNPNKIDRATMVADADNGTSQTYTLRASAKAKFHHFKIAFAGTITKNPQIHYIAGSQEGYCNYNNSSTTESESVHYCTISVFEDQEIYLDIDSTNAQNSEFSYWQCSGGSCPTTNSIGSKHYDGFTLKDDATVVYAHFGEVDKHCFVDEFDSGDLICSSTDEEFCIDTCDTETGTCSSAQISSAENSESTVLENAKWHLLEGNLNNIEQYGGHISIKNERKKTRGTNNKNAAVKVISTVKAGRSGVLRALFRLPQATASYGKESANITNSGFMLRSNDEGTEYLTLNMYVNTSGYLEARFCDIGSCESGELKKDGSPLTVSTASMVMMIATVTDSSVSVSAFAGAYYYSSTGVTYEYTRTFPINNSYGDSEHERVGYILADPNFKLYGIGWESYDYNSQCWQTISIKCSMAAKAQNGVIPFGQDVDPWIGHSGWFDSKGCVAHYYYYNGSDAGSGCGPAGESGVDCNKLTNGHYNFSEDATDAGGLHGYKSDGKDVKTAKAALECLNADETALMWIKSTRTNSELAHCGIFWTGKFTECSLHYPELLKSTTDDEIILEANTTTLDESTFSQGTRYNLRGSVLNVELENPDNNDVEIVLVSKHDYNTDYSGFSYSKAWGDYKGNTIWGSADAGNGIFLSNPVRMNGNKASFDVVSEFAKGAEGFDPEKVRSIIFKNHGNTSVTVKLVSASCKNVVEVLSCKAEYKDAENAWAVTANIGNISGTSKIIAGMKINEGSAETPYECGETGANCSTDDVSGIATFSIADNPYEHPGAEYQFKVYATSGSNTYDKSCTVTPEKIAEVTRECKVNKTTVEQGSGYPQFQFTVNGCTPAAGCGYKVFFGSEEILTGTVAAGNETSGSVKTTQTGNTTTNAQAGTYTYTVKSTDGMFNDCSADFTVTTAGNQGVTTTCSIENSTSLQAGAQGRFTFNVAGNSSGTNIINRNYRLMYGTTTLATGNTGSAATQSTTFTVPAAGGDIVLQIWNGTEYAEACTKALSLAAVSVDCGVSKYTWGKSGENAFSTTDDLYFVAKNNANIAGTLSVSVLKNGTADGSGTISNYSQWSSVKNIGKLAAGSYTYKLQYGGEDVCSHAITVVDKASSLEADCKISSRNNELYDEDLYSTMHLYFVAKNKEHTGDTYTVDFYSGSTKLTSGTLNNWSQASTFDLETLDPGTYTYKLMTGTHEVCSVTAVVRDRSAGADLTCGVSSRNSEIYGGNVFYNVEQLYFVAKNNENINDKLTDIKVYRGSEYVGETDINSNSNWTNTYSIGALAKGTYTFKLKYGTTDLCEHQITIKTVADDAELTCGVSSHDWEIYGGDDFTGSDYLYFMAKNNANINNTVDALSVYKGDLQVVSSVNIAANSVWTKAYTIGSLADGTYTFTLKNGTQTKCSHTITVAAGCHCTCSSGCNNLQSGSVSGAQTDSKCIFATEITQINENWGQNQIKVNGSSPGYCISRDNPDNTNHDESNLCTDKLSGIAKKDGGYYIEIPKTTPCTLDKTTYPNADNCDWLKVDVGGSSTPVCSSN